MNLQAALMTGLYLPALLTNLLRTKSPTRLKETTDLLDEYDYIVVGSGPGGSVMANRLSEDPNIKVLLLEAGKSDNVSTLVPAATVTLIGDGYDWYYSTTTQERVCIDKEEHKCYMPSGKVIGGSSAINFMIHSRGNKFDFDDWASEGNPGWSYDDVLPYFKKHENYIIDGKCVEDKYHSCGGELPITQLLPTTERDITKSFLTGLKDFGYDQVDPDGEKQLGVTRGYYTIRNGSRVSAATAFLRPIQDRTNLHIVLEAFVNKILIDADTKTATGVEFEKGGLLKQIKAKKEVILSAGPYASPKMLMLSGIGPKEELEKFKIPVIVDLPGVGQNLQESLTSPIFAVTGKTLTEEELKLLETTLFKQWLQGKGGLLASPGAFDAYAFVKSKYGKKDRPDLMLVFFSSPLYGVLKYFVQRTLHLTDKMWDEYYAEFVDKELFSLLPMVLHPKSRGTVTLNSSDPHDKPVIDPQYLANEDDRKVLLEGLRMAQKIINSSHFSEKGFKLSSHILDHCKEHEFNSDEYLVCTNKYLSYGVWSGCCTSKMGPDTDNMAVVDNRLRVKGIKRLRVVDASAFPNQVSALPAATVYMVGEKAAAMVKEDN